MNKCQLIERRKPISDDSNIPEGYVFEDTPGNFIKHVGPLYTRKVTKEDGTVEAWAAMRVEEHHVNAWNLCHAGVLTTMADIGTAQASWDPEAAPCVAIDLTVQFIGAPKLGELIEVCGTVTKRTRSLVFTSARGEVDGQPVFTATSIQKTIGK